VDERKGKYPITLLSLSDGEIIKENITLEGMECRYFEKQYTGKRVLVFILYYSSERGRKDLLDATLSTFSPPAQIVCGTSCHGPGSDTLQRAVIWESLPETFHSSFE